MDKEDKKWFGLAALILATGIISSIIIRVYLQMLPKDDVRIQNVINEIMPIADILFAIFLGLGFIVIFWSVLIWWSEQKNKTCK